MTTKHKTLFFDIEVAFQPEIVKVCREYGMDEKKLSWKLDANMRYVTNISYAINNGPVVDLSLLDHSGSLAGDANEKALLSDFVEVYNSCDETVAHYGSKFDIGFLNTRIAKHGLPPLKPLKMQDTWAILRSHFMLIRNTLDAAIEFFGCPYGKPKLGWEVWEKVTKGDKAAHKTLRHRCRYDVLSLRWIYLNILKPFATGRGNKAMAYQTHDIDDVEVAKQLKAATCPDCEATGSLKREGFAATKTAMKVQLSCRKCFTWHHAPLAKSKGRYILGVIR